MYPPRFTVEVCGTSATESSLVRLRFKGSHADLSTDILLPLYHQASGMYVLGLLCTMLNVCAYILQHLKTVKFTSLLTVMYLQHFQ